MAQSKQQQVILYPPDKTVTGAYMLAATSPSNMFEGWVKEDGSFTEGDAMIMEIDEGRLFSTAANAIAWAEARRWEVVNKLMFRTREKAMPTRMTALVLEAGYAPWYVMHPTVEARIEAGERLGQIEIKFEALDEVTPFGGCYILIDEQTKQLLESAGIRSPQLMVGRVLLLEADDPTDLFRPMRLVRIVR